MVLLGKPEAKRSLGRPRYTRYVANIEMDLRERERERERGWDGIGLLIVAQDWDQSRAVLNR
jgi:hypothetical protein